MKLRKIIKNIRNVFTNEQEREASKLAQDYFYLHDEIDDAKQKIRELEIMIASLSIEDKGIGNRGRFA